MSKFIELTQGVSGKKMLFNINSICNVVKLDEDYSDTDATQIDTFELDCIYVAETYEEVKRMIFEAENKQNAIANAILEIDQTLYYRLR